jgi:hypothetical protein
MTSPTPALPRGLIELRAQRSCISPSALVGPGEFRPVMVGACLPHGLDQWRPDCRVLHGFEERATVYMLSEPAGASVLHSPSGRSAHTGGPCCDPNDRRSTAFIARGRQSLPTCPRGFADQGTAHAFLRWAVLRRRRVTVHPGRRSTRHMSLATGDLAGGSVRVAGTTG